MKTKVAVTGITAGYLFLMSSLGIIAAVPGNTQKTARENIRREIIRNITCPEFVTETSEANDVKALISVDETGRITIHEMNSANPKLRNYVEETLNKMKVKNTIPTEKFVLVVKFVVG